MRATPSSLFKTSAAAALLLLAGCGPRFPPPPSDGGGNTDGANPIVQCNDGIDNDGDQRIDFPFDPGCSAATDPDETDPAIPPQCSDGADNDGDGLVDFPLDPGCIAAGDNMEEDPAACGDLLDNDGDGLIDFPDDLGCTSSLDDDETNPQCSDGVDNDGDGLTDFPNDPDCASALEDDEQGVPECMDGVDNDADALVDWPIDPGCVSDVDGDEFNPPICAGGVFVTDITASGTNGGVVSGPSAYMGSCGGGPSPEAIFWVNPSVDLQTLSITSTGTGFTPLLYVQTFCGDVTSEIACATTSINLTNVSAGGYFIFLDGSFGTGGAYTIDVSGIIAPGQPCDPASTVFTCDTTAGFACADPTGTGQDICVAGQCFDTLDNDGDGLVDFPNDPGCTNIADNDETDPPVAPQCADGIDNDGDGFTDFPADSGCGAASDDDEAGCVFNWDDGTLQGWSVVNTCASGTGWTVDSFRSVSPIYSLYYGDPALRNYECGGISNSGVATSPAITLSAGTAMMAFEFFTEAEGFGYDELTVNVVESGGITTPVWECFNDADCSVGSSAGAFVSKMIDLSPWAGTTINLELSFDTYDGIGNSTEGDYVDDIFITGACP